MEVTNRFKGLDLTESLKNYGPNIVQDTVIKTICKKKKKNQKGKMVVWGGPTNSQEKNWKAKEKRKDIPIWMQSSKE